jgi:hypothetical protein
MNLFKLLAVGFFVGLLFVAVIAAMIVFSSKQHDRQEFINAAAEAGATKHLPASELTRAFMDDEDAAREKYFRKVLLVEGIVAQVGKDQVVLEGHDENSKIPSRVEVSLGEKVATPLQKGQKVLVVGTCEGRMSALVLLEKARVLKQ